MTGKPLTNCKILITDYIWPDLDVEKKLLGGLGAQVVEAPDGSEATLTSMAADADAFYILRPAGGKDHDDRVLSGVSKAGFKSI